MPMTMVTIEQTAPGKWVADVESGGFICRREHLVEDSWENIMLAVEKCHRRLTRLTEPPAPQGIHGGEKDQTAQPAFAPARHQTRPLGKT
jgi:hypothetical protein